MKKIKLCAILFMCIIVLAGCNKSAASLNANEIKVNTLLIRNDGIVQSAIVEDFDKDYYSKTELSDFIDDQITDYNTTVGEDAVEKDSFEVKDGTAKVVFTYGTMKDYEDFNEVEAYYLTSEEAKTNKLVPDTLTDTKEGKSVSKEEALDNEDYKVIIVTEELDVVIEGKVLYYSNGILLNNTTVQSQKDGYTVIVYKPQ